VGIHAYESSTANVIAYNESDASASLRPLHLLQEAASASPEQDDFAGYLSTFLQRLDIRMLALSALLLRHLVPKDREVEVVVRSVVLSLLVRG
jgi:hypothetical protein